MRFFSSSALASAPKLRFAANCSAAETMSGFLPPSFALLPGADQQRLEIIWCSASIKSIGLIVRMARRLRAMTQMLRCLAFVLLRGCENLDRAARLLDRRDGGFRRAVNLDIQLDLDFTTAEQPHAILRAPDDASLDQRFGVDGFLGLDVLGIDRLLKAVEIVWLQPDQRRTLRVMAADRTAGLFDLDRLCGLGHRLNSEKR